MISVICKHCGKTTTIKAVKLEKEIASLKARIFELENKLKAGEIFNDIFKGGRGDGG
jgi:hypothetical protein